MEDTKKIFFICDGDVPECEKTECYKRGGECKWTSDVRHAVNFEDLFDYGVYFEKDRGTEEPRPCFSRDEKIVKPFDPAEVARLCPIVKEVIVMEDGDD